MTTQELKMMLADGTFHHATYRSFNTLWQGLWIYQRDNKASRGFIPAGAFFKDDPALAEAELLVKNTGISVGGYGQG